MCALRHRLTVVFIGITPALWLATGSGLRLKGIPEPGVQKEKKCDRVTQG
ncbi:hypothetical protein DSLASN_05900 [Desulfoluna limicola]|uniref:Uncharacterized protein n=1 Tax=Desulfoluna limicola TaxID=2810562 RepID=A0ABN6EX76_9BACT|nr:hypothetical protein DSLASN_05900 [Desulfoluna limicola]